MHSDFDFKNFNCNWCVLKLTKTIAHVCLYTGPVEVDYTKRYDNEIIHKTQKIQLIIHTKFFRIVLRSQRKSRWYCSVMNECLFTHCCCLNLYRATERDTQMKCPRYDDDGDDDWYYYVWCAIAYSLLSKVFTSLFLMVFVILFWKYWNVCICMC